MGDYRLEDSVYILFTTRAFATGIPGVLSASTVAVYEDVTSTPIETSIAVTETLNSINGLNAVTIAALAASGYNAGGHYHVVIEAGEVDSVSVIGEVVGTFSIEAASAAQNTSGLNYTVAGQVDSNAQYWDDTVIATSLETAADVADAVWDETMAGHVTADTSGLVMNDWQDGGRLDLIQDIIAADTTTDIPALIADVPTVAEFNARTLVAAGYFDPATDAVAIVTLVATTTTNTDMVGTDNAATEAKQDIIDTNVDNLNLGIIYGVAETGTLSTTVATTDLTGFLDDELIGRVIVFTAGTANGQASDITDYASASGTVTYTAIPTAPANLDTFKIV